MAIKSVKKLSRGKLKIDLTGPGGNVFALMGQAESLAEQLGKDAAAIIADMKSSNHDHAVEVFDREFGDYVDLYR